MALFFELLQTRPAPLCDCLFTFAISKTNRSLRKPYQILLPYARSTRYTKSFFYRSALLWNSLPHAIQSLTSKTIQSSTRKRMGTVQIQHTYEYPYPRRLIQAHLLQLYIYFFFILSSVKFSIFVAHQGDPSIRENTLPGNP